MINFAQRSNELELMDLPISDPAELRLNLRELVFINTLTGGPALVFGQLQKILAQTKREIHIADIGFGGGDMLAFLLKNQHSLPCKIKLTGVDLMPEAYKDAVFMHPELEGKVDFVIADYRDWFAEGNQPDIVLASLFCHHLDDDSLIDFFKNCKKSVRIATIINDLHRHRIAYYGIKWLTAVFSRSRFTKNDAPLSVLRGFKRTELLELFKKAGINSDFSIKWKWAFRWLIIIENN